MCGKGLELIEVDKEVLSRVFRLSAAGNTREGDVREEEGTDGHGRTLPDPSFVQVHEQDLSLVHHSAQINLVAGFGEETVQGGVCKERAKFVLKRRHHHRSEGWGIVVELSEPEIADSLVFEPGDQSVAVSPVCQKRRDICKRAARNLE